MCQTYIKKYTNYVLKDPSMDSSNENRSSSAPEKNNDDEGIKETGNRTDRQHHDQDDVRRVFEIN